MGAQVDCTDGSSTTPMGAAAKNGHLKIIEELILHSTRISLGLVLRQPHKEDRPREEEVSEIILKKLAWMTRQGDEDGNSPLHLAVLSGHLSVIDFLLSLGAEAGIKTLQNNNGLRADELTDCPNTKSLFYERVPCVDCGVCLAPFNEDEGDGEEEEEGDQYTELTESANDMRVLAFHCGHSFHLSCISSNLVQSCPCCRASKRCVRFFQKC